MNTPLNNMQFSRRQFGTLMGAAGLALGSSPMALSTAFAQSAPDSATIIKGKVSGMLVHNEKLAVMETPIALLREHDITPKEILFNRLHYPHEGDAAWYATTDAPDRPDWTIRVGGLVARERVVTMAELEAMEQVERVSVLQCAGNGRSYYAAKEKVAGGQWQNGGLGNVAWEGVPLRAFLDAQMALPSDSAIWMTAEGWDQPATPEGSDFAKSYMLADKALDNAIIALKMNGEPIPSCHGGPVRLVVPGYYGNFNVKFLTALKYESEQSPSVYQSKGYRFPNFPVEPGTFEADDYTIYNSRPTTAHQIKSVIFSPLPEDGAEAGEVEITGIAFNDGEAPVTEVVVSADDGATWTAATIEAAKSPWAWYRWSAKATLQSGSNMLMVRATDALGRTQPMDGLTRWNPKGYEWNGVQHMEIMV